MNGSLQNDFYMISFARVYLPGFTYGFGWIAPALIGFIMELVYGGLM